ncbi:MAG: glycosidase [Spirochaetes bacterium GWF1_41_5]|nr:MAG: glycosidase [Spirochaetes bacterium GWF1_41_5]HBE01021.1 glycosidase [Spirochaetia bacterium]
MESTGIIRLNCSIKPSQERVLIRPFIPGDENRIMRIISRVLSLDEKQVCRLLEKTIADFAERHQEIQKILLRHYESIRRFVITDAVLSRERTLLLGAYFSQEYSLEAAALFNPSIVAHPDQSNLKPEQLRFIISLRATGEGHISSIVFREGIISEKNKIEIRTPTPWVCGHESTPLQNYDKHLFARKLAELELENNFSRMILAELPDNFTLAHLETRTTQLKRRYPAAGEVKNTVQGMLALAGSNSQVSFRPDQRTSEKVIFPATPSQSNGIEDARFVKFHDDDGTFCYYATYTAYDGKIIFPQLLETSDFITFRFITLNGPAVKNKGMALFPRKINGQYAMLSRQDNENLYIMYSDNIHFWYDPSIVMRPTFPWEYVQIGNCGSPMETDYGWLVLTHGVGPIRRYCIGAILLDKNDPAKIIGRLETPLLEPNAREREGYVPNVVYTCGALIHKGNLIIPYAMSDYATSFAAVNVDALVKVMK